MSIPVITFFNNKGGVGKTSMVYHLAWMFDIPPKKWTRSSGKSG